MKHRLLIPLAAMMVCAVVLAESSAAWARAGGGGSRGSRSYSSPARPDSTPSSPSRSYNQPAQTPFSPQRPSMFGGLMGGLAGFALGGLLGSMLFGGMGMGGGFGIGMLEILLIGAGIFLLMKFMRRRQAGVGQPAYATAGGPQGSFGGYAERLGAAPSGGTATIDVPAPPSDLDRGLGHIRQMDARFDPEMFATVARNAFLEVQQAVAQRDVTWLRDRVAPEIYATLQAQCDRLRAARHTNHVEQIRISRAQVTEAWQESGRDYVTALIAASLLDYTVDDATGAVVEGSKSAAQNVEEYWTFVRSVGNTPWQLTAIQSA